jgi:hypothetical protein
MNTAKVKTVKVFEILLGLSSRKSSGNVFFIRQPKTQMRQPLGVSTTGKNSSLVIRTVLSCGDPPRSCGLQLF